MRKASVKESIAVKLAVAGACIAILLGVVPVAAEFNEYSVTVTGVPGIDGTVVDNETGLPVVGAAITGEAYPGAIAISATTNADGYFFIPLPKEENHTYVLNIGAAGYDPLTVTGSAKAGERENLGKIGINYNPFGVELSENSGSIARGYSSSTSYTGSSLTGWVFDHWEYIEKFALSDSRLATYRNSSSYKLEEEREPGHYGTRTRAVAKSRTDSVSLSADAGWAVRLAYAVLGYTVTANYSTVTTTKYNYHYTTYYSLSNKGTWIMLTGNSTSFTTDKGSGFVDGPAKIGALWFETVYARTGTSTETRQVLSSYTASKQVSYTEMESYQEFVPGALTGYKLYGRVEKNTTYSNYTTSYSSLSWGSEQTTVAATPRNGYTGSVKLTTSADGVQASLGSSVLTFASPARTTITMTPNDSTSGSPHLVTIRAYDSNGRLVRTRTYDLSLSSSKPADYSWPTSSTSYRNAWVPVTSATLTVKTVLLPLRCSLDGPIYVNGSYWGTGEQTQTVAPGTYTVSFGTVNGKSTCTVNSWYNAPAQVSVMLAAGESKVVEGGYTVGVADFGGIQTLSWATAVAPSTEMTYVPGISSDPTTLVQDTEPIYE